MDKDGLRNWRKEKRLTRKGLAGLLGVTPMAVAYWEWGARQLPALLPLALEALEHRLAKGGKDGLTGGVPGVQKAE
jgi:transcriptional regulator with XRE-family HTH domain